MSSAAKPQGGFVMTAHADLLKPGDSEERELCLGSRRRACLSSSLRCPGPGPYAQGQDPLTEPQIKLIADWVAQGAIDDTPASAQAPLVDAKHPPVYELLPVLTAVAYSPDGQLLAVSGYHEVLLHKGDGSGLIARLVGLSERIQSVAFSPDGKTLAVSGGDPGRVGEIQLWEVDKKSLRLSISVTFDTVYGVSWSPDGKLVACGCSGKAVRAFDAVTGKQVLFQGAHSDWVMGTVFSQDGDHLLSVSRDRSVKLTEVPTNRFIDNVTSITPGASRAGCSRLDLRPPKDLRPAQAAKMALTVTHVGGWPKLATLPAAAAPATKRMTAIPPDAKDVPAKLYHEVMVAGADGQPRLYKIHREAKRVIGDDLNRIREYEKFPGRIYAVTFDKTGRYFAAGSSLDGAGEARVYDVDTGKRVSGFEGVKTPVYAIAFRPDGNLVATAGFDGMVRLSDPMTGKLMKEFVPVPGKK